MSEPVVEVSTCQKCGERIVRRLISGSWAAWLHEAETLWFINPHPAVAA